MKQIPASKRGGESYKDISKNFGGSSYGSWQNYPTAPPFPSKSLEFEFSGLEPPSFGVPLGTLSRSKEWRSDSCHEGSRNFRASGGY